MAPPFRPLPPHPPPHSRSRHCQAPPLAKARLDDDEQASLLALCSRWHTDSIDRWDPMSTTTTRRESLTNPTTRPSRHPSEHSTWETKEREKTRSNDDDDEQRFTFASCAWRNELSPSKRFSRCLISKRKSLICSVLISFVLDERDNVAKAFLPLDRSNSLQTFVHTFVQRFVFVHHFFLHESREKERRETCHCCNVSN